MLNTDLHSKQIKHKMDKTAFIKNNRGINDEGDLPEDFLGAIFDEIHKNEIVMKDEGKV
jgi:brefeldin A-inhibited guanine nucleotide-exchange protein